MVERPELRLVLSLLSALDAELLRDAECWFAGGTAVSLRCGEDDPALRGLQRLRDRPDLLERALETLDVLPATREMIRGHLAALAPAADETRSGDHDRASSPGS
jgi:hypothetical protein